MKKIIFVLILVICLAVGGLWKYKQIKNSQALQTTPASVATKSDALPDGEQLTKIVKETAKTDMTPEEYREVTSFKVTYPSFGTVLVPGQTYTVTWVAGKMARAPSYQVRLIDSTYQFDTVLGNADETIGKFSFTVPDMSRKQYEKYQLVFSNVSTVYNSGGTSDYFYIKNTTAANVAPGASDNNKTSGTAPIISYSVSADFPNGATKITVTAGDWANYEWTSTGADSLTETYSATGCVDPKSNETRPPRDIAASGKDSFKINTYLIGCTLTKTLTAKNTKTRLQSSSVTTVTVK